MKMLHASPRQTTAKPHSSSKIKGRSKGNKVVRHSPRLDTVKMVENAIKKNNAFDSRNQLWRSLPKAIQYPTFITILDYLVDSNKIVIERDGTIIWTFVDSSAAKQSLRDSRPF